MNKIFLCILFFISTPLYSYNNSKDIKNDIDKIKNIDKETIIIRNPIEKESYINIEYEDNKNKPTRVIKYLENNKKINSKLYYSPIYNEGMQKFFSTKFDLNLFILIHESMHLTSKQSYIPKSNKDIFKSELAADIASVLYYHRYNNFNKQSTIKYIISIQRLRTHLSYYKESYSTYIGLEIFKSVLYKINHFNYSEIPFIAEKVSNNIINFNFQNHFEFNLNTENNIKNTYFEQLNFIKSYLKTKNNIENLFYNK